MLKERRLIKKIRIRARVFGTKIRPRLSVFRSSRYIYAQIIDDTKAVTLVSFSDLDIKQKEKLKKSERAKLVGENIALLAIKAKIKKVVFDRGGYTYHGRVKALAEGAREKGLVF